MGAEQNQSREVEEDIYVKRNRLFKQYAEPLLNMIYKLCIQYSNERQYVDDNYNEVLANIYSHIETYDETRSIKTWIHIVTKRFVFELDKRRSRENSMLDDQMIEGIIDEGVHHISSNSMCMDNYRSLYNDDILEAIDQLNPIHRDALLLQLAGYTMNDIVEIEYKKGNLKNKNIDTVKSRLFRARECLQKMLTPDGKRK